MSNVNAINQKSKIRGNIDLLNMLLQHLHSDRPISEFKDPFTTCRKTYAIYKKQAELLYKINIKSICKCNMLIVNKLCNIIRELPVQFLTEIECGICDELALIMLISELENIKKHLSKIHFGQQNKMNFSSEAYSLGRIIHQISAVILLYKLIRRDNESLYCFLCRNSDLEFLRYFNASNLELDTDYFTKKEGDVNRKYLFTVQSFVLSFVKIQQAHYRGKYIKVDLIVLRDRIWLDRIVSTAMDI